jgi:membrane protein implicated in regulation of membrane protease activity
MIDVLWLVATMALFVACLLQPETRTVRMAILAIAVAAIPLSILKSVQDGRWWTLPIAAVVLAVMIVADRRRSSRPESSRRAAPR